MVMLWESYEIYVSNILFLKRSMVGRKRKMYVSVICMLIAPVSNGPGIDNIVDRDV